MDGAWLTRMRWRRRGAWMWPVFVALTVVDAFVVHEWPPDGNPEGLIVALWYAGFWNLVAVAVLARPTGALLRRVRRDLPRVVARDYAGTWLLIAFGAALLAAGLSNRSTVSRDRAVMRDAEVRAIAWIGYRAPLQFRADLRRATTVTIQAGSLYRICVPSASGRRTYCVVVNDSQPVNGSVHFDGYESNTTFVSGVW